MIITGSSLAIHRQRMKKIIVNGSFDLLHPGHIRLLNYAKSLGDYLLVAVDTDDRIRQLKGESRPYNTQCERTTLLENLKSVDEVKVFDSELELLNIIKQYQPNTMVKGSDYQGTTVVGEEFCGEIVFLERDEYSTTRKIQSFTDRR